MNFSRAFCGVFFSGNYASTFSCSPWALGDGPALVQPSANSSISTAEPKPPGRAGLGGQGVQLAEEGHVLPAEPRDHRCRLLTSSRPPGTGREGWGAHDSQNRAGLSKTAPCYRRWRVEVLGGSGLTFGKVSPCLLPLQGEGGEKRGNGKPGLDRIHQNGIFQPAKYFAVLIFNVYSTVLFFGVFYKRKHLLYLYVFSHFRFLNL